MGSEGARLCTANHRTGEPFFGILLLSAVVGRVGVQQADDSDLLDLDLLRVIQLDLDVLEDEGPHVVAEPVRIEVSLWSCISIGLVSDITRASTVRQRMR